MFKQYPVNIVPLANLYLPGIVLYDQFMKHGRISAYNFLITFFFFYSQGRNVKYRNLSGLTANRGFSHYANVNVKVSYF